MCKLQIFHIFASELGENLMWLWMSVCSAILLGVYDVTKKQSLKRNSVLHVLLGATALTALFLCPFLEAGTPKDHLALFFKGILVTTSWVSGLLGMKYLPLTTVSTLKASRPVFVVVFSIILFGEKLNVWQWAGVLLVIAALYLLSLSSKKEGIKFTSNKGVFYMVISIFAGAASALYDKHILGYMEPLFVQSWANVYITGMLLVCVLVKALKDGPEKRDRFTWDWRLLLIAVLITLSDGLYFFALKDGDALLSVISMLRRCSVVITFVLGALIFKEKRIKDKALDLVVLLAGVTLLLFGSSI